MSTLDPGLCVCVGILLYIGYMGMCSVVSRISKVGVQVKFWGVKLITIGRENNLLLYAYREYLKNASILIHPLSQGLLTVKGLAAKDRLSRSSQPERLILWSVKI